MKITRLLWVAALLSSCGGTHFDSKAEGEKLMQTSREWSKLAATDSVDKVLSYWADDAVMMSPGQAPLTGKKAIREMIEESFKIPGFRISWEPLSVVLSNDGEMGYLIEKSQITIKDSTGKEVTEFNKGVTIWKKGTDGNWKNVVDIWNADLRNEK